MDLLIPQIPKNRNRSNTIQRIVEALETVILERGLEGLSITHVAEKADVSKVLIYRYFGGLDGLLDHYVRMGKLFPIYSTEFETQIHPERKSDLSRVWYRQVILLYRSFRRSKIAPQILRATFLETSSMAEVISKAVDEEKTRLVNQLSFTAGADNEAISAVILGGMSYMTIMAQQNRLVMGLDLREEANWKRIEEAVKLLYIGLNKLATTTEEVTIREKSAVLPISAWI